MQRRQCSEQAASGPWVALATVVLACCACGSGSTDPGRSVAPARTALESVGVGLHAAVTTTCLAGSSPTCVRAGSQHVLLPADFTAIGVRSATVAGSPQTGLVEITLDAQGGPALAGLSTRAVHSGQTGALVLKVGDALIAMPVAEAYTTGSVQILPPEGMTAEDLARRLGLR